MEKIDHTNRYPWGKIMVDIYSITNFPFYNNLFIRISCIPYILQTKKIIDNRLDFNQRFFFPVHNHFNTLKIELINILNDGWFREHMKESVVASFEIRLPDIDKEPFDINGRIRIPVSDSIDFKKMGLKAIPDAESKVKRGK
jgi:hypothetical protein